MPKTEPPAVPELFRAERRDVSGVERTHPERVPEHVFEAALVEDREVDPVEGDDPLVHGLELTSASGGASASA